MSVSKPASIYDRIKPNLDAADLIRRLGLTQTRTLGSEAYCNPLCHDSVSGESLQVNLQTGRWNCKACQSAGVHGDLFQLVEYVLTGGAPPSHGNAQGASPDHLRALSWLCEQFGIAFDRDRVHGDPALDVVHMVAMIAHQALLEDRERLAWVEERWGFDRETVEAYGIGYLSSPLPPSLVNETRASHMRAAFRASGLGWYDGDGHWSTRFEGRVTFPYLEHGRAVYLIGRSTPWTPERADDRHVPKYHKLSVHSERRPYISERVTNNHLYNETVMSTTDEVGVVEGVADAVAFSSLGASVVSPVTISFNSTDLDRFVRKCHENGIRRVWILFDNELSGSGNWAARRVGLKIVEGGIATKILTLPLGQAQLAARDEVLRILGPETFEVFERSDPRERKAIASSAVTDPETYAWLMSQVEASKIDGAEWCALEGAGAAGRFDTIKRAGEDVVELEIADVAKELDPDLPAVERADAFREIVNLVAHVEERMFREAYAGTIAKAAGKGVPKTEIAKRISAARRIVTRERAEQKAVEEREERAAGTASLMLLPPEQSHSSSAPAAPQSPPDPNVPRPPGSDRQDPHERYSNSRTQVLDAVAGKAPEEMVGEYVAQTILVSMGYTSFRTTEELYLVRGSERVAVGLANTTPEFNDLVWLASGLTPRKSSHRSYIAVAIYFLSRAARRAEDVSWSFVDGESVYFPTGDEAGHIVKIEPGRVTQTKMSEVRVPAVAGESFLPFRYVSEDGGVERALDLFRWTSISASDRLVLIYWIVCFPVLRRIGTIPIVRIEGGSSSGKTRVSDSVSYLVNGKKSSSVPTAPALISRLSTDMLTVDDNRETCDVSQSFLGTLLQATHLGAREKRKSNSDTGTIVERVAGALLMNGVEPIHDGRSELASRMLTLRCQDVYRSDSSPSAEAELMNALSEIRDAFWSDAARRCSVALELDALHGERIGDEIEEVFGETRIGRLSSYLRMMYLAWVAGLDERSQAFALDALADPWREAFSSIAAGTLSSLLDEELSVTVLRYVFAYGASVAEPIYSQATELRAFSGKFVWDTHKGDAYLGPVKASQLARLARAAGKELNAPASIARDLRAGQLERRVADGVAFIRAAGFEVDEDVTRKGKVRYTFGKLDFTRPKDPHLDFEADDERA